MKIYMGYDAREAEAYRVAVRSLSRYTKTEVTPIDSERLAASGLFRRPLDRRGNMYDLTSNAPCSTEFAISRFLTPMLAQTGWALFVDCDVIFRGSPLAMPLDDSKAVMVVKHRPLLANGTKMDGQSQQGYDRKNWSSVMVFNCDHPANRRLTLQDVNERPGRDLHAFYWLHDAEIGELPADWNWLVNVTPKPGDPKICHFTLGTPNLPGWHGAPHDDIWLKEAGRGE